MSNEEIKNLYISAEVTIAALQSDRASDFGNENEREELLKVAKNVINDYKTTYKEIILTEKPNVAEIINETNEAVDVLKLIPETSYETISELNTLITNNSKKIQNELSFNEDLFYEKYFATLSSKLTTKLNPDILKQDRFKDWFGNSKVVDKNGNPLVVYHGTGGKIDEFTKFKFEPFPGNYFAENKSYADWFSKYRSNNSYLFQCYLRVQNPIDLTPFKVDKISYEDITIYIKLKYGYELPENKMLKKMSEVLKGMEAWRYLRNGVDWLKFIAKTQEFDGFHYMENNPDDKIKGKDNVTVAWLIFNPSQIKVADSRNSTFSLYAKDFRMKKGGQI